jgi:Tfp pilus assembly major pilin PilA
MIAFIGMAVIALLVGVGVYAILTQVKIRDYRYETDKDGNEKVIDENE